MIAPPANPFSPLAAQIRAIPTSRDVGSVTGLARDHVEIGGLERSAALGDRIRIGGTAAGQILSIGGTSCRVMMEGSADGLRLGMPAVNLGQPSIAPSFEWLGRVVDPDGFAMDGRPLGPGEREVTLEASPPPPARRRGLGERIPTGFAVFDTLVPLVRGQRIGLFAGSGVGKSRLLGELAQRIAADVVVIGLIGERGREVRDFVAETLPPEARRRSVVVAATSDRPALTRARAAFTTIAIAEYFRDAGLHVLLLSDSITRFAEAQSEIAASAGEPFGPSGYPASMARMVMALAERAGPGADQQGDITAILSVLVAGSDMDGGIADLMRGVLDGHVVLSRDIAERGRYPAIDVLASASRALPAAATDDELRLIGRARQLLSAHRKADLMLRSGLYVPGADAVTDAAVAVWEDLDRFVAQFSDGGPRESFAALADILDKAG